MRCDHVRERMGPLIDGELPDAERDALTAHAAGCTACAQHRDALNDLHRQLQLLRQPAPRTLAPRLRAQLALEAAAARPTLDDGGRWWAGLFASPSWQWRRVARFASVLIAACVLSAAAAGWVVRTIDMRDVLARDVLSAHMRSLLQNNAVQVASLDTHTVKPWFAGRLEFTPVVKDLGAEGFQLVGGRLDYVNGKRVAALVYRRRLHQVNVFVWPSVAETAPTPVKINGYNLLAWSHAGMAYWAVSDLNEGELRELPSLL